MVRVSPAEMARVKKAIKQAKRADNAKFQATMTLMSPGKALGGPPRPSKRLLCGKALTKALDREFSLCVRKNWPICFFPGCGQETKDCFHFFTRAKHSIRWDFRNAVGSCKRHNILYEHDQAFIDDVRIWFVNKWGQPAWDNLKYDGNQIGKFTDDEKREMIKVLVARRMKLNVLP